jgi:hypothetical protein
MAVVDLRSKPSLQPTLGSSADRRRWIDRLDARLVRILTTIGFGFPAAVFLWLITHYGVNVIEGDQWDDVTVIRNSYSNLFDWGSLWAQHNENRIFFPNLIVIALSRTVHFDIRAEEYLSAIMLIAATALVILTHKRRSPTTPWLYYCPVAFLMFSLCQYGNMLWGFQMAWYLVLVAMAISLFLLDRVTLTWAAYSGAMVAAVIGSFSSLQGLLIWPVGLILLYHRRRAWNFVAPWVVVGVASVVLYMHNFNSGKGAAPHSAILHNLVFSAKFYTLEIGDVLGIPFNYRQAGDIWLSLLGLAIILVGVGVILVYGIRRDDRSSAPFGVALVAMGLLFAGTVTEGRVIFGAWAASASRYTTFDLLVPVGIYLALLDRPRPRTAARTLAASDRVTLDEPPPRGSVLSPRTRAGGIGLRAARVAILVLIVAQLAVSLPQGIWGGRASYVYQATGAKVLRNIDHLPNAEVVYYLYIFSNSSFIRRQAKTLQSHHLSVFAGSGQSLISRHAFPSQSEGLKR